jgi:hypothetical protein
MAKRNDRMPDKRTQKMKRLSAILVVLVMLGICTSSYGYFLIYNLSGTIRGTDGTVDIKKVTTPFKGYMVLNVDNDTNSFSDANMIIYGKDPNHHKVYVLLNATDSNAFLNPNILFRAKRNFYELNGGSPFDFRITMLGHVYKTNIGISHERKDIAPALGGVITSQEGMFLGLDQELAGTGNISAMLYTIATKGVNDPNNHISPHTQSEIVDTLKEILESKERRHRAVNIPAPQD